MTGNDIIKRSASLLGYSDRDGEIGQITPILSRGVAIINQISNDLNIKEIKNLSDEIVSDKKYSEAMTLGVSMLIAQNLNDTQKANYFTNLYNLKRGDFKSKTGKVKDILPKTAG